LQNKDIGVGKEQYFESWEAMGVEPIPEETPPEMEDFPYEVQQAFDIYSRLSDRWDGMSGTYLGKDYNPIAFFMDLFLVVDKRTALDFISIIDVARQGIFANKQKSKETSNGPKL
jgi:hypothetical protein